MKKYFLLIVIIVAISGCKKNDVIITPGLFGKWEMRLKMGSIAGFDSTFKAGNGRILQFKSDSTYAQYSKNRLVNQGTFHIRPSDFPSPGSKSISFDGSDYADVFILKGDSLQIGMDFDDGIETRYVKISDN